MTMSERDRWPVLEPGRIEKQYWQDLWRYRELFLILAWRDIAVHYKQTVIGVAWTLIRPLLSMVVFTVIFGKLAKLPTEGSAPYAILVFAAMLPWQFFASALTNCSESLIANSNLLTKVYFPRLIVPVAAVITSCVDFLISFVILAVLMLWFQWWPSWRLLTLPLWVAVAFAASMGAGLWLASLNVQYRDFRYAVPLVSQPGSINVFFFGFRAFFLHRFERLRLGCKYAYVRTLQLPSSEGRPRKFVVKNLSFPE